MMTVSMEANFRLPILTSIASSYRPGAPSQQIWTRPRPGPPQEPRPHHHDDPGHEPAAPGEKGPFEQTITAALSLYVFNHP